MFDRVAIVGVGLIGGSVGMALRHHRLAASIVGIGRSEAALEKAVGLRAIHEGTSDFAAGIKGADLVVLATPIPQILADLARLQPLLAPGAVVTDVGSVKSAIAQAGDSCLPGAFVAAHPMAGSERSGVEAARYDLFQEATWALTPTAATDPAALQIVRAMAQTLGARVITLSPEEHDRVVAVTSHLPHIVAYALAAVAGEASQDAPHLADLAAGSFHSGTRVAQSSPELWRDICATNRDALLPALQIFRGEIDRTIAALEQDDTAALEGAFRKGFDARQKMSD